MGPGSPPGLPRGISLRGAGLGEGLPSGAGCGYFWSLHRLGHYSPP